MSMALSVIGSFENLRNLRVKEENKTGVLKGQVAAAPLVPTVEMLEDLHNRIARLEAEQDKKGVMVPDPSKGLVQFVLADNPQASEAAARIIVKALMGRVLHEVRKVKAESEGELRAAMSQKKDDWRQEATGSVSAMVKLEERLIALLKG